MPYKVTYTNPRTGKRTISSVTFKSKAAAKRDMDELKTRRPGCNPRIRKVQPP